MEPNVIKFTDDEMQFISQLQAKYQQKLFELGQLELNRIDLDQQLSEITKQKSDLLTDWKQIQEEENKLMENLTQKYGDGTLSLKDGTFKPLAK